MPPKCPHELMRQLAVVGAVTIPGRAKVSIAELQRKKRKHSKRAAQGTAAAARGQPSQSGASLPPSATPEDQRCVT